MPLTLLVAIEYLDLDPLDDLFVHIRLRGLLVTRSFDEVVRRERAVFFTPPDRPSAALSRPVIDARQAADAEPITVIGA